MPQTSLSNRKILMKIFDIKHVQTWQKKITQTISLNVKVRQKDTTDPFYRYAEALDSECENIHIDYEITNTLPEIQIKNNLHFHSIPEKTEIEPFINALNFKLNPPELSSEYAGINTLSSSNLILFVSPHCPNCPSVMKKMIPIVWLNPNIELTIIDVGIFPEMAEKQNIQSVPTLTYNDFKWTGLVKISEIIDVIQKEPDQWDTGTLERMLLEGKAIQLAQTILDNGKFVQNFDSLIAHELLSVRLGAMVCVESIAEENRPLAKTLCDQIWSLLSTDNIQVQGDLIYLIGICGSEQDLPKLENMAARASDNEIKESISEAIESIQEQS